jgi:peptidoglycan/LPS O-acetylase OafA/YrhL
LVRKTGDGIMIAERLAVANGRPLGFDYLRLILALSVVGFHSFTTSHNIAADHLLWRGPWRMSLRPILPMFFALSGFLVAGSLARSAGLLDFLTRRVLRIVPALFAEILLSALVLGPLLTSFPLQHYFVDRQFFSYFLNTVGDVHFSLPGVFLHNPRAGLVNGSLWTIPFEGFCYLALSSLALLGVVRHRRAMLIAAAAVSIALSIQAIHDHEIDWAPTGSFLVACFLSGVALSMNRDRIAVTGRLAALAASLALMLLSFDGLMYLAALPLAYVTVCIGLLRPPATMAVRGDYSYGVYLFAYPIQQACVQLWAGVSSAVGVFLIAAPLSIAYAAFSWHLVEWPILSRKRQIAASITGLFSSAGHSPAFQRPSVQPSD